VADLGVAAIALTQTYAQFQSYMPKITDVRKADPADTEMVGDVRMGEIASLIGSLGVGLIVSSITGDPTPAYVSVGVSLTLIMLYEYTLRANRPMEGIA
jgi:hypothetical protein